MSNLEVTGTVFPGGAPDDEVATIMDQLSDLQTWATLLACKRVPKSLEAIDLIQRTRVLIVERLYPTAVVRVVP